jgi:sporulation protein YlmC with PRC-barrel domain
MSEQTKRVDLLAVAGNRVLETSGENLGRIHQVVANLGDGRIEHVILRLASDASGPPRYVVIPWSQFSLSADQRHLQLDFSLAVLKAVGAGRSH